MRMMVIVMRSLRREREEGGNEVVQLVGNIKNSGESFVKIFS
jgi:hypothetical protein